MHQAPMVIMNQGTVNRCVDGQIRKASEITKRHQRCRTEINPVNPAFQFLRVFRIPLCLLGNRFSLVQAKD